MPAPTPPYPKSTLITSVTLGRERYHKGDGDMWPITWAADNNQYGGAGDNQGSPMNFWRIEGNAPGVSVYLVDNLPVDHRRYCRIPPSNPDWGIKPAGLLGLGGRLYFAVEAMNYGENPAFNRQRNVHGWIVTTDDYGKTWDREATPTSFFDDRLSSCHFLQFGRDYAGAIDDFVYAYFPAADDGHSYWENGDYILLGRVAKDGILQRDAWTFFTGLDANGNALWHADDTKAQQVFRYPSMTGENHVSYNPGLKRYLMGNYGFIDEHGRPRPYHQGPWPKSVEPSQLTLYEAPNPWGPWSLFHRDDNWGSYGGYQPSFPTKWMSDDGCTMWMVSAGTYDDYNFTFQKVTLGVAH